MHCWVPWMKTEINRGALWCICSKEGSEGCEQGVRTDCLQGGWKKERTRQSTSSLVYIFSSCHFMRNHGVLFSVPHPPEVMCPAITLYTVTFLIFTFQMSKLRYRAGQVAQALQHTPRQQHSFPGNSTSRVSLLQMVVLLLCISGPEPVAALRKHLGSLVAFNIRGSQDLSP